MYRTMLRREADEAGLSKYVAQAESNGLQSVALDLLTSAEYMRLHGSVN
jgi:hypothetical protein